MGAGVLENPLLIFRHQSPSAPRKGFKADFCGKFVRMFSICLPMRTRRGVSQTTFPSGMRDGSRKPESLKGRLEKRIARKRGDVFLVDGDVVTVTTDQTVPPDLMAPGLE